MGAYSPPLSNSGEALQRACDHSTEIVIKGKTRAVSI
jgi:hypothetical protein